MVLSCDYYVSPVGKLRILANSTHLLGIHYVNTEDIVVNTNSIIKNTIVQLEEYFKGIRKVFSIPIDFIKGTEFQKSVWYSLSNIAYGQTLTYQDVAVAVNRDKAVRAVGNTNRLNPISIIVPCHRVIGKNKKLVGYAGGLDKKQFLLDLENNSL